MKKGEKTKQQIIILATDVFNQKGYFGTSLTDIMKATDLKKGVFIIILIVKRS